MILVLMGVSGSGKSTIGTLLAAQIGSPFVDADDLHPQANREKMAAGHALDDADRQAWLEELNHLLLRWAASGNGGVLACSALKEKYRRTLVTGMPEGSVAFVLLEGTRQLIAKRLAAREHEYMNPKLMESQFQTLEPPADAVRVVNDRPPQEVVDSILSRLAAGAARGTKSFKVKTGEK